VTARSETRDGQISQWLLHPSSSSSLLVSCTARVLATSPGWRVAFLSSGRTSGSVLRPRQGLYYYNTALDGFQLLYKPVSTRCNAKPTKNDAARSKTWGAASPALSPCLQETPTRIAQRNRKPKAAAAVSLLRWPF